MDVQIRYHRQVLLPSIGREGQERLNRARVLLIGCGALGTVIAEQLVRAGVGWMRICDRDVVEMTNLQRQVLFDESDAEAGMPKAIAARDRLAAINSEVHIEQRVVDVHAGNIEGLMRVDETRPHPNPPPEYRGRELETECRGRELETEYRGREMKGATVDLVLDGTDNAQTRYLINDAAVKLDVPWVYGACVGTTGRMMGIRPGKSACLRCLFPQPPGAGELPTCDTAGVLSSAAGVVASLQVVEAMKLLLDDPQSAAELVTIELWPLRVRAISTVGAKRSDCPACGLREFDYLKARSGSSATTLCGRNTVQVRPPESSRLDLKQIAKRLDSAGAVQESPFFVRCALSERAGITLTVFPDGRTMVHGTADTGIAQSLYARYVGN